MKRIFIMLFLLVLLVPSICLSAENEFTFSNGIKFGDDIGTVRNNANMELSLFSTKDTLLYSGYMFNFKASVRYDFDINNKLTDIVCFFTKDNSYDSDYQLKVLKESLTKEFGLPIEMEEGYTFAITGKAFEAAMYMVDSAKGSGEKGGIRSYCEWLVTYPEYTVKIDLVNVVYSYGDQKYYTYQNDVSFCRFTEEEYKSIVNNQ